MRVIIYRRKASKSAVMLAEALRELGVNAKKRRTIPRRVRADDFFVSYGEEIQIPGVGRKLNDQFLYNKLAELQMLNDAGVPTIHYRSDWGVEVQNSNEWLTRSMWHSQASDLLGETVHNPYWVKKEEFVREFRIHVFNGVSIRAGMKFADNEESHPWIRSSHSGWTIKYNSEAQLYMKQAYRDAAKSAVEALGLTFAAVDIGVLADGSFKVLECNRAPGLNEITARKYAEKIVEVLG